MDTPYGEIPDRLVPHMGPGDMHEYLQARCRRRSFLTGAAAVGLAAVAGPVLWRRSDAYASTAAAPQWIAYGADPTTQMYVSWSTGTAKGTRQSPPAPQVRFGLDTGYGGRLDATNSGPVPVPGNVAGEPTENTVYNNTLIAGLDPDTTYHYSVSNDGSTWSPDATFHTAPARAADFRFTAFGDHGTRPQSTTPMAKLVAGLKPAFCVIAGDMSYATPGPIPIPQTARFNPSAWDSFLGIIGPNAAQSIPWQVGVGTHEVEPLEQNGYAGVVTRFPQHYDLSAGSPVVHTFTYGNVAFIQLDGNDLSAQAPQINGYTKGAQTAWLEDRLAAYRAAGSGIDFVVVSFGNCVYSTNKDHGSDGAIRDIWGPLFDRYQVDLVINGHVHAYERTNPIRAGQPTTRVEPGGTVHPATDGTTYINAGGAGQGLYKTWWGSTDAAAGDKGDTSKAPKVWRWSGGGTAAGGNGHAVDVADTAKGYSAFRRAHWHCLVVDVSAPSGGETRMSIKTIEPAQVSGSITDIGRTQIMDSVTLVRSAG